MHFNNKTIIMVLGLLFAVSAHALQPSCYCATSLQNEYGLTVQCPTSTGSIFYGPVNGPAGFAPYDPVWQDNYDATLKVCNALADRIEGLTLQADKNCACTDDGNHTVTFSGAGYNMSNTYTAEILANPSTHDYSQADVNGACRRVLQEFVRSGLCSK